MARRHLPEPEDEARIEMTPMIDVTFLLLVFFLCTLRFKSLEGRISAYLPKDVGIAAGQAPKLEPITVALVVLAPGERRDAADPVRAWRGKGPFTYVGRRVEHRVGPRTLASAAAAAERVRALREAAPDRDVKLAPDAAAIHGEVVALIDALRAAGIEDVVLRGAAR
jgi:biopolymer transport protein ExbD